MRVGWDYEVEVILYSTLMGGGSWELGAHYLNLNMKRRAAYALISPPRTRRRTRAGIMAFRRAGPSARALAAVGSRRALVARGLAGGAIGLGALGAYGAYRGIRRIKRARARSRAKRSTGISFFPSPCRQIVQLNRVNQVVNDRVWSAVDLCAITPTGSNNINNARISKCATISGFKHWALWNNTTNVHIRIHQYWIVPKQYTSLPVMTDTKLQEEFYTNPGQVTDGDVDWVGNQGAMYYRMAVNSEKFTVLKKKTFMLAPASEASVIQKSSKPSYREESFWIPLNRKYTYEQAEGDTSRTEQAPVFYISFVTKMNQKSADVSSPMCESEMRVVTYFRDDRD